MRHSGSVNNSITLSLWARFERGEGHLITRSRQAEVDICFLGFASVFDVVQRGIVPPSPKVIVRRLTPKLSNGSAAT